MLKPILTAFVATVLWVSTSQAGVVGGRVTCESNHDSYVECETGATVANPRVVNEFSDAACTFGSTWGYYGSTIWVNHNCRADFAFDVVGPAPVPTPCPTPGPVPTPRPHPRPPAYKVVDCRWNSQNWQPWYTPVGHFIGRAGFGFQDANACVYTVQSSIKGAICNWTGNGFTSYDMETNVEVVFASYPTLDTCYDAVRYGRKN